MKLRINPALQRLLEESAIDQSLPQELRAAAAEAVGGGGGGDGAVEWATVKALWQHRRAGDETAQPIHELCRGSGIAFPQQRKRQGKPPELIRRLEELKARLEQQQYDAMVADVIQNERAAAAAREGGLATYRQQISFGIHVIAMMAAFYAFGHVAGMALTSSKAMHPLVGLAFMVFAMLLETVLFIIRSTVPPKLHLEAGRRAVAARVAHQQEQLKEEAAAASVLTEAPLEDPGAAAEAACKGLPSSEIPKPAAEKKED